MRGCGKEVRKRALEFTGRFGFITRDIFFEYLCPLGRSQKFSHWKALVDEGWLILHSSESKSAYLSIKARRRFAPGSVPARSKHYIEHDQTAATLLLELESLGTVERYWTERELVVSPFESHSVLGCQNLDKIPDLVMDLSGSYGRLRVAVEVERTPKTKERYQIAALSYLEKRNVDLILYICRFERTAHLVRYAFSAEVFNGAKKAPGIFISGDFSKNRLSCELRYRERRFTLVEFLSLALKKDLKSSDAHRTAVRCLSGVGGRAA